MVMVNTADKIWKHGLKNHFYNSELNNDNGWLAEMMNGGDCYREIEEYIEKTLTSERKSWVKNCRSEIEEAKERCTCEDKDYDGHTPDVQNEKIEQILKLPSLSPLSKEE